MKLKANVVRISSTPRYARSSAGISAHAAPPAAPAAAAATIASHAGRCGATPSVASPATSAPMPNWPSLPIVNTPARSAGISPSAITSNGATRSDVCASASHEPTEPVQIVR